MKIVHLCLGNFYVEDMAYQENILPKMHAMLGHNVTLIVSPFSFDCNYKTFYRKPCSYVNRDGIPVRIINYSKVPFLGKFLKIFPELFDCLEVEQPDIVFVHGPQFFGNNHLVKYKKKYPNVIIICDNHSDYINTPIKPLKYFLLNKIIWPRAVKQLRDAAVFFWGVTPQRVQYLQEMYKIQPEKTGLLVMGGDDTLIDYHQKNTYRSGIRAELGIPEDDFVLIMGGKINQSKRIRELVQAFIKLKRPNVHLIIFGQFPTDMQELYDLCQKEKNIHPIGWIESSKAYSYFLASDLGVFPGTHSVLWEQAIACGLPCIFKKWEGMDHVQVANNCILIDQIDVQSLTDAIKKLLDHPTEWKKMQFGAELARKSFLYSTIAEQSIQVPFR